jgi:hypothetical protein
VQMRSISVDLILLLSLMLFIGVNPTSSSANVITLADTINQSYLTVNWSSSFWTFQPGLVFNAVSLSDYDTYIQQYASKQDWLMVLRIKQLAEENGYNSPTIDNITQQAIKNMPMLYHLPLTETWNGGTWFVVYDRYVLNAYRYGQQYGYTAKWDKSDAYQELLATYNNASVPSLGYNPITLTTYQQYTQNLNPHRPVVSVSYSRYYDEVAETLDTFLKLGGNDAGLWNYLQNNFWTGTMYGYTNDTAVYECEVGFFALIIGNYYVASGKTVPYFDRVYTDLYNKLLVNGWNSSAWGIQGVLQHALGVPQLRLENTFGAILALQAFSGSSNWQSSWVNLLTGSNNTSAWQALIASPLYSNGQFREYSDSSALDTEEGMMLLFLEGIIPNTGSLAIPLNEEGYQDTASAFPSSLFRFDYVNRRIRIPVNSGVLKFQFGTRIASATFPLSGVYEVQFSNDWNSVIGSPKMIGPLPSLFHYLQSSSPVLDATVLSNAFLSTPSDPNWNPTADLNNDGIVNILDAIILGDHFLLSA